MPEEFLKHLYTYTMKHSKSEVKKKLPNYENIFSVKNLSGIVLQNANSYFIINIYFATFKVDPIEFNTIIPPQDTIFRSF